MLLRSIYTKQRLVFFEFKGKAPAADALESSVPPGMCLRSFSSTRQMPSFVKRQLFPYRCSVLRCRMARDLAEIVVLTQSQQLIAYGWIQSWRPFRRVFRAISERGTMIGPAWTHPEWRGQGLHSLILRKRILLSAGSGPLYSFVEEENIASMKGLKRTGFFEIGLFDVHRFAYVLRFGRSVCE